jgi:hypothetical protein
MNAAYQTDLYRKGGGKDLSETVKLLMKEVKDLKRDVVT